MNVTLILLSSLVVFLFICLLINVHRVSVAGWAVIVGLFVALAVTNPEKGKHATSVKDALVSHEDSMAGRLVLDAFAGGAIEVALEYDNYIFFSTTTAKGRVVSLGFLTQVLVFAKEKR